VIHIHHHGVASLGLSVETSYFGVNVGHGNAPVPMFPTMIWYRAINLAPFYPNYPGLPRPTFIDISWNAMTAPQSFVPSENVSLGLSPYVHSLFWALLRLIGTGQEQEAISF